MADTDFIDDIGGNIEAELDKKDEILDVDLDLDHDEEKIKDEEQTGNISAAGGGDIEDEERSSYQTSPVVDYSKQREERIADAKKRRDEWESEHEKREEDLERAQREWIEITKKVSDGELDKVEEIKAQEEAIQAKFNLLETEKYRDQAIAYYEQESNVPDLAPAAAAWYQANSSRYGPDRKFTEDAQRIMHDLKAQGMDDTHQEFYRKLDAKMKETPKMMPKNVSSGVGNVVRTGRVQKPKEEFERITAGEARFIRGFGKNPKDKRVIEEWNRSKQRLRTILENRRRA